MQNRISNGLKPKLVKQMAMLLSMCYLLGPLQPQLTLLLHELSHGLEMPAYVLSHETTTYDYIEVHEEHQHDNRKADHDHELIDLVNTIFEASNDRDEPDKVPTTETKVKKHTPSKVLVVFSNFLEKTPEAFFSFKTTLNLGHLKKPDVPPQLPIA